VGLLTQSLASCTPRLYAVPVQRHVLTGNVPSYPTHQFITTRSFIIHSTVRLRYNSELDVGWLWVSVSTAPTPTAWSSRYKNPDFVLNYPALPSAPNRMHSRWLAWDQAVPLQLWRLEHPSLAKNKQRKGGKQHAMWVVYILFITSLC